jgi:hypothetical protein
MACRGVAALAPAGSGTTSLVTGTGADELADTLRLFGGSAIEGEPGSTGARSEALDAVFLWNDGFCSVATSRPGRSPRTAQRQLLGTCHGILKPGGCLILGVPNRFGLPVWAGMRDDLTGLRWVSLLPRPLADACSRLVRDRPYRQHTHGRGGYSRLLRNEGFEPPVLHLPWPRLRAWNTIVHDASRDPDRGYRLPAGGPKQTLAATLLRWLRPVGLDTALHPAFVLVARTPVAGPDGRETPSLVERIIRSEDLKVPCGLILRYRSQKLHFAVGRRYFRLPLTRRALEGQRREAAALRRLASHPVGRCTPRSSRTRELDGAQFSVADVLEGDAPAGSEEERSRLGRAFEVLFRNASVASLEETATWERIFSPENREAFRSLGCGPHLRRIEEAAGRRRVPVGPVHGDLHPGNLLASDGRLVIIDWDRFEEPGPLFLDALHGILVHSHRHAPTSGTSSSRNTHHHTVRRLLDRDPRIPLLERADAILGEATWTEAVSTYQLSWLSRQLPFRKREMGWHETGERYRERLSLCTSRLEGGRTE